MIADKLKKLKATEPDLLTNIFDVKSLLMSFSLTILFYCGENFLIGVPHLEWFRASSQKYNALYFAALSVVNLGFFALTFLYFHCTLLASAPVKIVSTIFFGLVVACEYGYWHALSRFMELPDLEVAMMGADPTLRMEAIFAYFDWRCLFPIAVFALTMFFFKTKPPRLKFYHLLPVFALNLTAVFASATVLEIPQTLTSDVPQRNAFVSFYDTTLKMSVYQAATYNLEREKLTIKETTSKPRKNIILITDESVRASNLSLYGYERETTPYLTKLFQEGKIKKFNSCVSGATCSISSGKLLLSGMRIEDLPDLDYSLLTRPTIDQYAKAAGYTTHFFDGQMSKFWRGAPGDLKNIDDWRTEEHFAANVGNQYEIDFEIARETAEIINSSTGNFIWIWKRGVHYFYNDDFPADEAVWKPSATTSVRFDLSPREEVVNTYDNAIKYNLDAFFEILVPAVLNDPNNIVIYTSDHGQNLYESGTIFTHCSNTANEANVPLFLMGGENLNINPDYKAAHENIFPTLLDLMDVPAKNRKYKYADSLLNSRAQSPPHRYFWGVNLNLEKKNLFD